MDTVRKALKPFASLQLTVALLAFSLVLVFFGTLAQKKAGIWQVVDEYFWSWITMVDTQLIIVFASTFFEVSPETTVPLIKKFPIPGGKLIGFAMFANLLAAHALRFTLSWRRSGIFILHGGLLLLFVGEYITREYAVEQQMIIFEGETVDHTIDTRNCELAFVLPKDGKDQIVAVPAGQLKEGAEIDLPDLPFRIKVLDYQRNSGLKDAVAGDGCVSHGPGRFFKLEPLPPVSGVSSDNRKTDNPAVRFEVIAKDGGASLGTYLAVLYSPSINTGNDMTTFHWPQTIRADGKSITVVLRNVRFYKPYKIKLEKVHGDFYAGTGIARNYSSDITRIDPDGGSETAVTIRMNEPMRYRGETFYQSGVNSRIKPNGFDTTVLQVVENPGWRLPYIACAVVTFGMLLHFGIHLREYLKRMLAKRTPAAVEAVPEAPRTALQRWLPWGILAGTVLLITAAAMPHGKKGRNGIDLTRLGRLPVLDGGRIKPLDTVARVHLRLINHKEYYVSPEDKQSHAAIDWWLSLAADTASADRAEVFRIESDQMLNLFGLKRREGLRYSYAELGPERRKFDLLVQRARKKSREEQDLYDAKLLDASKKLNAYENVKFGSLHNLAARDGGEWNSIFEYRQLAKGQAEDAIMDFFQQQGVNVRRDTLEQAISAMPEKERESLLKIYRNAVTRYLDAYRNSDDRYQAWENLFAAYRNNDAEAFEKATEVLEKMAEGGTSETDRSRVKLESWLNDTAPYFWCIGLYVFATLLVFAAWICFSFNTGLGHAFRRSAILVLLFAFVLHTITLIARMYLMDRWWVFVTNLYSTAVFIGWAAVGVCLLIERLFPITLGCIVAAVIGFLTSILAHNLAAGGDTLEMLQAVLDTNFWLATHVTTINLGYSATYIAGLVGIIYLCIGIYTPHLTRQVTVNGQTMELGRLIGQVLYGAVAAATILSFVGTVLGGIWGDQSWGRFWGWDPKENGALMIVLWNALILHARWAGLVKDRGIAILALGGNMITTWSYFGTNQLEVGLHAYGFSKALADVCMYMWILNIMLVSNGLIPKQFWRSYQQDNLPTGKPLLNKKK